MPPSDRASGGSRDTYDEAGRRVSEPGSLASLVIPSTASSATYDADNRLTNWTGIPLTYDANGNLSSDGSSSYSWNARDELIGPSDGGGSFTYDAFGRRTSQTVTGVTTPYLYDGENPATISGYMLLNGLGIDERFAETSSVGASSYLSDGLGSTIGVTDGSGSMIGGYAYAPYGATSFTGSVTTPFEFTGRENDGASNLYYYRARYYSSELGRFISEDPAGFAGGLDFYAYVEGDPVSAVDPRGLYLLYPPDSAPVNQAIAYLEQDPGMTKIINDLEGSATAYHIEYNNVGDNEYIYATHTIRWDPNSALCTTGGSSQTPALGLGHEMAHADFPALFGELLGRIPWGQYTDLEEWRVITGPETAAAQTLGEGTRTDHGGTPYYVQTPTSR